MLIDMRSYKVRPGMLKKVLELYQKHGKEPQVRHLGEPLGFFLTETGNINEYTHLWIYQSANDREKRRTALFADPQWLNYLERSAELGGLLDQNNRLLKPVDFYDMPHLTTLLNQK